MRAVARRDPAIGRGVTQRARIRLGTRRSPLALWQAEWVAARVQPLADVTLVPMESTGDRTAGPLWQAGGKGLFVKELDHALVAGDIDIAVHSTKDVPGVLADGVALAAFAERADPADLLISRTGAALERLPHGACVGTSSPRRQWQLLHARPDLRILPLRGNVATRLGKLDAGEYDAIVLAKAGVDRLGITLPQATVMPLDQMLPAVGQGALAIAVRTNDATTAALVRAACAHAATETCVGAERALLAAIGGDCHTPLAGYAELHGNELILRAFLSDVDGSNLRRVQMHGPAAAPQQLGHLVAKALLKGSPYGTP